jgi:hypothetical protein
MLDASPIAARRARERLDNLEEEIRDLETMAVHVVGEAPLMSLEEAAWMLSECAKAADAVLAGDDPTAIQNLLDVIGIRFRRLPDKPEVDVIPPATCSVTVHFQIS